jgi:hypothetical protein
MTPLVLTGAQPCQPHATASQEAAQPVLLTPLLPTLPHPAADQQQPTSLPAAQLVLPVLLQGGLC